MKDKLSVIGVNFIYGEGSKKPTQILLTFSDGTDGMYVPVLPEETVEKLIAYQFIDE